MTTQEGPGTISRRPLSRQGLGAAGAVAGAGIVAACAPAAPAPPTAAPAAAATPAPTQNQGAPAPTPAPSQGLKKIRVLTADFFYDAMIIPSTAQFNNADEGQIYVTVDKEPDGWVTKVIPPVRAHQWSCSA